MYFICHSTPIVVLYNAVPPRVRNQALKARPLCQWTPPNAAAPDNPSTPGN